MAAKASASNKSTPKAKAPLKKPPEKRYPDLRKHVLEALKSGPGDKHALEERLRKNGIKANAQIIYYHLAQMKKDGQVTLNSKTREWTLVVPDVIKNQLALPMMPSVAVRQRAGAQKPPTATAVATLEIPEFGMSAEDAARHFESISLRMKNEEAMTGVRKYSDMDYYCIETLVRSLRSR